MDTIDLWVRSKLEQIDQSKKQEQLFQNNLYLCMSLIEAAGVGDIRKINLLLKEEMDNLLYRACARGYKSAVEELLSQGASVNYMAEGGSTPLHAACIRGYENIVEVLESKKTEERRPMKERPRTKRPKINMLRENANVVAPLVTEKLVGLICPREGGGRSTNKSLLIMTTVRRSCRKKRQLIYTYTASHIPHTRAGNTLYDANQLLLIVYNITQPLCAVFRSQASIWKTR
jgi:ankyrin repeat protein